MTIKLLIEKVRQALNRADHADAERILKQINWMLNGSDDQ